MFRPSILSALACALGSASAVDVFAHFMVSNSYGYDVAQWKTDMRAARQVGIDGFSMNWSPPNCDASNNLDWMVDRIRDAYQAAEDMGFKMYHSFDMDNSECDTFFTTSYMQDIIAEHAGNSAAYRWNSNLLVTTFGGDTVDAYGNGFFQNLKNTMKSSSNAISLAPALTSYSYRAQDDPSAASSSLISDYPSLDGYKNWQAWPLDRKANMTTTADAAFASALASAGKTGPYIMTISPWQFKDWPAVGGSWVQYSDTLWADRWASLLGPDAFRPDIIEIVSWNDWPESHYIRDLPALEDTSATDYTVLGDDFRAYVDGQNHSPWRTMAKYYIARIKTGRKPQPVMDQVVFWYRVHPKSSCSSSIRNSELPDDAVFAWALVKEKATVSVSVGSNKYWEFEADPSGPAMFRVPFPDNLDGGVTPEIAIMRGGEAVQFGRGSKAITGSCDGANFNPVVGLVGPGVNSGR